MDNVKFSDSSLVCRILSIDNGTDKVGFTIIDYDIAEDSIDVILCETFEVPNNYRVSNSRIYSNRGSLMSRLSIIGDYYEKLLDIYSPDIVGCESPFGFRHMNAFRTLTISMQMFDDITYDLCPLVDFIKISPFEAKKAASGKGKFAQDKDSVHDFLFQNKKIKFNPDIETTSLGPDALDSLAVGLATVEYVLY